MATSTPAPEPSNRETLLRTIYTRASAALRDNHIEEFNNLRTKYAEEYGVDWAPRMNAEQKARADLERLLAENPSLLDLLAEMVEEKKGAGGGDVPNAGS